MTMYQINFSRRGALAALFAAAVALPAAAQAPLELKITAPAGAGGGWDGAARSMQQVMTATGAASPVSIAFRRSTTCCLCDIPSRYAT